MEYFILFLEGILTFISPCILPMLPLYMSYFMANNKPVLNTLGFVVGFSSIFTLMGAFSSTIGKFFNEYMREINLISGSLMIIFGLNYLGIIKIAFLNKSMKVQNKIDTEKFNLFSAVSFGIVFGIGWTPCVGPFLGSALMVASNSGDTLKGVLMLLSFSVGLGLPFIMSSILIDSLKGTFDFIKKNYNVINKISGSLLVIIGTLMATGNFTKFLGLFR